MRKITIFILIALLLAFGAAPVSANSGIPSLPHAFYGSVSINGSPAPDGTQVSATVDNGTLIPTQNPVTTVGGNYGVDSLKLLVQGDITPGTTITFHVTNENGTAIGGTYLFEIGGGPTQLVLEVTIAEPSPPPPVGAPTYYIETNLFGVEAEYRISSTGKILETIEATSEDGMLTMTIPEGTIALDKESERLSTLTVAVDPSPPDPPEDAHIIGLAYDFGPDGATFDPPITLEYSYDPEALPEGVDEEDLVLAYYDEEAGEWVECECTCDPDTNCITACVCHFTSFAIIGEVTLPEEEVAPAAFTISSLGVSPSEVAPSEEVNISVLVANIGGESGSYTVVLKINGVKEQEKSVTIAAGGSKTVSFSVTREEADTYAVTVDGLSGSFTVVPVVAPPAPAAFSVSRLSFQPAEVEAGTAVTIAVLVSNTGGTEGSYTVVLKVNGVKEAEKTVTIAAGDSQEVSFSLTRDEPGTYSVSVDGLSGGFTVIVVTPPPGINWALIGGIIGGVVIVAGLLYYFLVFRRRAY